MVIDISGIPCLRCGNFSPVPGREEFEKFFNGESWECRSCEEICDLWTLCLAAMRSDNPFIPGVVSVGLVNSTTVSIPWQEVHPLAVSLSDYGIPNDAAVIDIFLTPATHAEPDGNEYVPDLIPGIISQHLHIRSLPHDFSFSPMPFVNSESGTHGRTLLNILILWIEQPSDPEMEPLMSAAKAFATRDFRGVAIPAQITVELKLNQILTEFLVHHGYKSENDVKGFLKSSATYSHQREFLMPALFNIVGAPPLPEVIREELKALNTWRNKVGHTHAPINRSDASVMILASLFGYRYLVLYAPMLANRY